MVYYPLGPIIHWLLMLLNECVYRQVLARVSWDSTCVSMLMLLNECVYRQVLARVSWDSTCVSMLMLLNECVYLQVLARVSWDSTCVSMLMLLNECVYLQVLAHVTWDSTCVSMENVSTRHWNVTDTSIVRISLTRTGRPDVQVSAAIWGILSPPFSVHSAGECWIFCMAWSDLLLVSFWNSKTGDLCLA